MNTRTIIENYYRAWVDSDRDKARALLHKRLKFRSPEDNFDDADEFINACWKYSEGFDQMEVIHTVYAENSGYIVYRSGDFCCGELLKISDDKISEIYVTFNPTH